MKEQSVKIRTAFVEATSLLVAGKILSMPLSRSLPNIYSGLNELRLRDRTGQIRIFYFMKKADAIYMLHAFRKKTQELPQKETEIVLRRLKEV